MWLLKCIKGPVSENPSAVNVIRHPIKIKLCQKHFLVKVKKSARLAWNNKKKLFVKPSAEQCWSWNKENQLKTSNSNENFAVMPCHLSEHFSKFLKDC